MAFVTDQNFKQAWSRQTTLYFLRKNMIAQYLNASYQGDVNSERVYVQRPDYKVKVKSGTRKRVWGTGSDNDAKRIQIDIDKYVHTEHNSYVIDEIENVVTDYRARDQQVALSRLADKYEDDVIAYIDNLDTADDDSNAGAGPVKVHNLQVSGGGFNRATGKPTGNAGQVRETNSQVADVLDDIRVALERSDTPVEGGSGVGGSTSKWVLFIPPEIHVYGFREWARALGLDLPFAEDAVKDGRVFAGPGMRLAGKYLGFDIVVTRAIPKPAGNSDNWRGIAMSSAAIAAPMRPMRNYVTLPENNTGEFTVFRHVNDYGIGLVNKDLVHKIEFASAGNV